MRAFIYVLVLTWTASCTQLTHGVLGGSFLSARGNFLGFNFCDESVVQVISQLGLFIADMAGAPRDFPRVYSEVFSFFQEDWICTESMDDKCISFSFVLLIATLSSEPPTSRLAASR